METLQQQYLGDLNGQMCQKQSNDFTNETDLAAEVGDVPRRQRNDLHHVRSVILVVLPRTLLVVLPRALSLDGW